MRVYTDNDLPHPSSSPPSSTSTFTSLYGEQLSVHTLRLKPRSYSATKNVSTGHYYLRKLQLRDGGEKVLLWEVLQQSFESYCQALHGRGVQQLPQLQGPEALSGPNSRWFRESQLFTLVISVPKDVVLSYTRVVTGVMWGERGESRYLAYWLALLRGTMYLRAYCTGLPIAGL